MSNLKIDQMEEDEAWLEESESDSDDTRESEDSRQVSHSAASTQETDARGTLYWEV